MLHSYFKTVQSSVESNLHDSKTLIFRGIPSIILEELDLPERSLRKPWDSKGRISLKDLDSRGKEYLIHYLQEKLPWVTWEEYCLLSSQLTQLNDDYQSFTLLTDNSRALYRLETTEDLEDTEELAQNGKDPVIAYNHYYAEVIEHEGVKYYRCKEVDSKIEHVRLFPSSSRKLDQGVPIVVEPLRVDRDYTLLDARLTNILYGLESKQLYLILPKALTSPPVEDKMEHVRSACAILDIPLLVENGDSTAPSPEIDERIQDLLEEFWGTGAGFRPIQVYENPDVSKRVTSISQGEVVQTIINECDKAIEDEAYKDVFLTAPTGAGKSLLFQLPAFYLSSKHLVTVVVSPLIALMRDQVKAIREDRGFEKATYINSEISLLERGNIIEQIQSGEIDMIYLSPELFLSYDLSHFLGDRKLGLLVIDEAHLVTTWGRDFRVDYWFLGNHIKKVRKYTDHRFPVVAVTATAVYGGVNDMVFDCIDSLNMKDQHKFIGDVKREDIEFRIANDPIASNGYRNAKLAQTKQMVLDLLKSGKKSLVYFPYTSHIKEIYQMFDPEERAEIGTYYGAMAAGNKSDNQDAYLKGQRKVMLATKAFGMGIDISDIEVVYHHAPNGHLTDYVQEIGRAARKKGLQGYACLNFSARDMIFSKQLYGMSAIRQWQVKAVIEKVLRLVEAAKNPNILLSTDDFSPIFANARDSDDVSSKVMSTLMMIEKDYLMRYQYNVLIARPKKLFTISFARVHKDQYPAFIKKYRKCVQYIPDSHVEDKEYKVIRIDLNAYWEEFKRDNNFPSLKRDFYNQSLWEDEGFSISPQLKLDFSLPSNDVGEHEKTFIQRIEGIRDVLYSFRNGMFTANDLQTKLQERFGAEVGIGIGEMLLSAYASKSKSPSQMVDSNAFLQQRLDSKGMKYRLITNKFDNVFSSMVKRFVREFSKPNLAEFTRYVPAGDQKNMGLVRFGYLLEILQVGTFDTSGGESPMVFVRVNDKSKLWFSVKDRDYTNSILADVERRHVVANQIFEHFFLKYHSQDERMDFVEDYFLGMEVDELLSTYQGQNALATSAVFSDVLKPSAGTNSAGAVNTASLRTQVLISDPNTHPPTTHSAYSSNDLLSLEVEGAFVTQTMAVWVKSDPIAIHKLVKDRKMFLNTSIYAVLFRQLEVDEPEYYLREIQKPMVYELRVGKDDLSYTAAQWISKHPEVLYKAWKSGQVDLTNGQEKALLTVLGKN